MLDLLLVHDCTNFKFTFCGTPSHYMLRRKWFEPTEKMVRAISLRVEQLQRWSWDHNIINTSHVHGPTLQCGVGFGVVACRWEFGGYQSLLNRNPLFGFVPAGLVLCKYCVSMMIRLDWTGRDLRNLVLLCDCTWRFKQLMRKWKIFFWGVHCSEFSIG